MVNYGLDDHLWLVSSERAKVQLYVQFMDKWLFINVVYILINHVVYIISYI